MGEIRRLLAGLSLLWDLFSGSAVLLAALAFLVAAIRAGAVEDWDRAATFLFAFAVLWGLRRVAAEVSHAVRMLEYIGNKPWQSATLIMGERKHELLDEFEGLKRKAGLPSWWTPR
jgi:hypothetical protein